MFLEGLLYNAWNQAQVAADPSVPAGVRVAAGGLAAMAVVPVLDLEESGPLQFANAAEQFGNAGEELATTLQARAAELNLLRSAYQAENGTTAAVAAINPATGQAAVFISTNLEEAEPALAAALRPGEVFIEGAGHAEQTALGGVPRGWSPLAGGSSRGICYGTCAPSIEGAGMQIGGPMFPSMPQNSPYRMFWSTGQ